MLTNLIAKMLGLKRKDFIIGKIFLLAIIYLFFLQNSPSLFYIILPIWGITIFAYWREKTKNKQTEDSFEDDNLFYRYGTKISSNIYPLRFNQKPKQSEVDTIILDLKNHLVESIREDIDSRIAKGSHSTEVVEIYDRYMKGDLRTFTRFSYVGLRGGEVSNFILFEYIGAYIIIHFDSCFKGVPHWYDMVNFLLSSPIRIWFWIIPWLRNDFSILTRLSRYLDNSFEEYDLDAYYVASTYTILDSIKDFLADRGLLTPELENMITNQFFILNQTTVNGNQMNITGSNNILSSITQKAK